MTKSLGWSWSVRVALALAVATAIWAGVATAALGTLRERSLAGTPAASASPRLPR